MKYFVSRGHLPVAKDRAGLSLFEILTALFVLMVGLLGVLAVLPFGMYQISRVNKADLGGNCGRAAIQEIQVRNWASDFDTSLYDPYGNGVWIDNPSQNLDLLRCDRPIIVDPLLLFENNMAASVQYFPAVSNLPRLSCKFVPEMIGLPSSWNTADVAFLKEQMSNAFYWKDDRNFAAPASPNVQVPRPVGVMDIKQKPDPDDPDAPVPSGPVQSHENYSWLYMLTPQTRGARLNAAGKDDTGPFAYSKQSDVVGYLVDVVVFFDRNTNADTLAQTERSVTATRARASDLRGGEFPLTADTIEELDMKDTRWVLLSCVENSIVFAKWYRVANASEVLPEGGKFTRKIMLLGPDVPDVPSMPNAPGYSVTLLQGAIHVYSSVVIKN